MVGQGKTHKRKRPLRVSIEGVTVQCTFYWHGEDSTRESPQGLSQPTNHFLNLDSF